MKKIKLLTSTGNFVRDAVIPQKQQPELISWDGRIYKYSHPLGEISIYMEAYVHSLTE